MFEEIFTGSADRFWFLLTVLKHKNFITENEMSWIENVGGPLSSVDITRLKTDPKTVPDTLKFINTLNYKDFLTELKARAEADQKAANEKRKTEPRTNPTKPENSVGTGGTVGDSGLDTNGSNTAENGAAQ